MRRRSRRPQRALYPATRSRAPYAAIAARLKMIDPADLTPATRTMLERWREGTSRRPRTTCRSSSSASRQFFALPRRPRPANSASLDDIERQIAASDYGAFRRAHAVADGLLVGLVVARTAYHLAVADLQAESLATLPRLRLAMPRVRDGHGEPREVGIERYATIGIDMRGGYATGFQSPANVCIRKGPQIVTSRTCA